MNFNEKETVDFIDYGARHLNDDVDYVFYPQGSVAADWVIPLYIKN
jgi:hypothetical protein